MRHLVKMASFSSETNMHARNLAIVWAPNLLRFAIYAYQHARSTSAEVPLSAKDTSTWLKSVEFNS